MAHQVPSSCPFCHDILQVTQLHCPNCDTTISGHFDLGKFQLLTEEQRAFAELFIRCEGKLTRVGSELGLSYPTVRNKLNELIRALGYTVEEEPRLTAADRQAILDRLAAGEISSEEAIELLSGR